MRSDFAIFIMVHGRPDKMWTLETLRRSGYTGKVYFVADNLDETVPDYMEKYGDDLLVFDKNAAAALCDSGDNSGDLRSTLYAANTIPELARGKGVKYFMIVCDDYTGVVYNFNKDYAYHMSPVFVKSLDGVIDAMIDFYSKTNALTLAMAQGGDFIGGRNNSKNSKPTLMRKAMNTFLCSIDRPTKFMGRLNEDVTTYTNLGNKGELFFTFTDVAIKQKRTQSEKRGLTDVYINSGTYVKSFFSVMYNPSCVKVAMMGDKHRRIHHLVSWNNAVPCIVPESIRKVEQ
jgi:hypothetical protein